MSKHIPIQGDESEEISDDPVREPLAEDSLSSLDQENSETSSETSPETSSDDALQSDDTAERLMKAEQSAQESYDRLLRVSAEFDNYKKRSAREMQDAVKYANEKLAGDLLTVVDNLERAIESATVKCGDDDPLLQGVSLVLNDVMKILENHHVKPITALGEPFDPALHQAMMREATDEYPPNTVVREMQKGYLIHERLLRPTMVAVSAAIDDQT
jgi:molecular chaperone GrpE